MAIYSTQAAQNMVWGALLNDAAHVAFNNEMDAFVRRYDDEILSLGQRIARLKIFQTTLMNGHLGEQQVAFDRLPPAIRLEHGNVINTASLYICNSQLAWLRGTSREKADFQRLIEQLRIVAFENLGHIRDVSLPPNRSDIDEAWWESKVRYELFQQEMKRWIPGIYGPFQPVDAGSRFNNGSRVHLTDETPIDAHFAFSGRYTHIQTSCPRNHAQPFEMSPNDFWQMVQEQRSSTIVMLNELTAFSTFVQYWPEMLQEIQIFGDIQVQLIDRQDLLDENGQSLISKRCFQVSSPGQDPRTVSHLQYRDWVDGGAANVANVCRLIDLIAPPNEQTGPFVIHCGAGMGRTRIFSLILRIAQNLRENGGTTQLRIENFLSAMKHPSTGRAGGMVVEAQYQLCHEALRHYRNTLVMAP